MKTNQQQLYLKNTTARSKDRPVNLDNLAKSLNYSTFPKKNFLFYLIKYSLISHTVLNFLLKEKVISITFVPPYSALLYDFFSKQLDFGF